jgi:zinc transport system substrate-binding protein
MNKVLLILFLFCVTAFAKLNTVVSILPQKTFLEQIGGDKINISLMVKPGNSPHTYEPKPSQMVAISKAKLYFAIDIEFEHVWLDRFLNQNKNLKVIDVSKGIKKLPIQKHSHDDEHHGHKEEHHYEHGHHAHHEDEHHEHHDKEEHDEHKEKLDPHVWTSVSNVKIIAKNIYEALASFDKPNQAYYKSNYDKFLSKLDETDKKIKSILSKSSDAKFMIFHPAWGYFAKEYDLIQVAIESGGKNPTPKHVMKIIKEAKEENIKAIFTSPEFSDKVSKQIAKELGIPVKKVSPLNPKWSQNLINFAKAIAK